MEDAPEWVRPTKRAVTLAPQNSSPGGVPGLVKPMASAEIRAWITAPLPSEADLLTRVRSALAQYFRPDLSVEEEDMLLDDWLTDLSGIPTWAISEGFRRWRHENPKRKPTSGDIRAWSRSEVRRLEDELRRRTPPEPEPERQRVSAEAAKRIMAENGFKVRRMTDPKGADDGKS